MKSDTTITFRGMESSDTVTANIEQWLERLGRHHTIQDAHVTIEAAGGDPPRFNAHIHLHAGGHEVIASREVDPSRAHANPWVALRDAMDASKRQLEDLHERQTARHRHRDSTARQSTAE
ncbi:MAG: ribosome-associated translation inhibitor RaiA [Nannocystaceae bacterium]|nr:ribosome-associated translation inhibitor RaiA [Nannocystaceae bacterium]